MMVFVTNYREIKMFDEAYRAECNIEVSRREIEEMNRTHDYPWARLSFAFACGRYWSIMLSCHGGEAC